MMEKLVEYFRVSYTDKKMIAQLDCTDAFKRRKEGLHIDQTVWKEFLARKKVVHGIQFQAIERLAKNPSAVEFPLTIAKGRAPIKGTDGKIEYVFQFDTEINREEDWNFRDVMKIPSVTKGQKLATIKKPTAGKDGMDVTGSVIKALSGKKAVARAGKNVIFYEKDDSFYAEEAGQFTISCNKLNVYPQYEVNETLSLKNGNLDFVGTIVIRGDVPTGFTVKAQGDVKIFGMVEAATVIAGGSIFISEGISGQGRGRLQAGENIRISYINQASVDAGKDLYVENSILHSECTANGHVYCQRGNIIGRSVSAGKTIEAKDIGTRLNTNTEIIFGVNKAISDRENTLSKQKKELEEMLQKLRLLGQKLSEQDTSNPKIRISLLRQRNSYEKTIEKLDEVNLELAQLNSSIGDIKETKLIVRNFIYENVSVTFGKYKRIMKSNYHYVQLDLHENEIGLHPLYS